MRSSQFRNNIKFMTDLILHFEFCRAGVIKLETYFKCHPECNEGSPPQSGGILQSLRSLRMTYTLDVRRSLQGTPRTIGICGIDHKL